MGHVPCWDHHHFYISLEIPTHHLIFWQAQAINVTGAQWYWEIDKEKVELGKPVVFNVHTSDVNHGMGVLNSDGKLLFQIQAMPGYVNKIEHTFKKPGDYKVICLEFCGVAHHDMITEFEVVALKENKK